MDFSAHYMEFTYLFIHYLGPLWTQNEFRVAVFKLYFRNKHIWTYSTDFHSKLAIHTCCVPPIKHWLLWWICPRQHIRLYVCLLVGFGSLLLMCFQMWFWVCRLCLKCIFILKVFLKSSLITMRCSGNTSEILQWA